MLNQQLRSRCLDMIKALPVPAPFDLERFRANIERHRGRRLRLHAIPTKPDCSGLWIATRDADHIYYASDTTPLHQWHIIGHEAGHMLFGHQGASSGEEDLARLLFPSLDPAMVRAILARSAYTDTEEEEAETFASVLLERARQPRRRPSLPPAQAELLSRVEGAFGTSPRGDARRGAA
jgi:hypothetical protein